MTDEQHDSIDQENNPPTDTKPTSELPVTDEIDVVSALAALSSLHEFTQEEEAEADSDEIEDDLAEIEADTDEDLILASEADDYTNYTELDMPKSTFPHPPLSVLHRGQIASIVPAALLIGAGALLTVMLTTSADATLDLPLIGTLAMSGLGLILITHWLSSSRWTVGSFFVGLLLLLCGGMTTYLILPNNLNIAQGWPLLLTAIGTAFVITDLVSPTQSRLWLVGLVLAISGFAGIVITANFLEPSIIQFLSRLWPVALVIVAILLIVPVFRRNGQ